MIYFSKELPKMLIFLLLPNTTEQSYICIPLVFAAQFLLKLYHCRSQYFCEAGTEEGHCRVPGRGSVWRKLTGRVGNRMGAQESDPPVFFTWDSWSSPWTGI